MSLPGKNDLEKFDALAKYKHKDQLIWCLNGLWDKVGPKDAEKFWVWWNKFCELDLKNRVDGNELDELNAHRFYEQQNNTHTVKELRDKLREIGWERRPMMFPAVVFVILEFKVDWHMIVNAAQGDNKEELEKAQRLLDEVQALLNQAISKADAAAKAAAESAKRESELKAAQAEVEAALNEVKAQEEAREKKTRDLTEKSNGTGVKAGMAKQELAQHLAADPLPLRKAKITLEAANRKAQKAADAATVAREAADAASDAANAAVDQAQAKVAEAQAFLEEVKKKPGSAQGAIWFAERELAYRKSFLPSRRQ